MAVLVLLTSHSAFGASYKYKGEITLENAVTPEGVELGKLTLRYKLSLFLGEGVRQFFLKWEPPHDLVRLGSINLHAQVVQDGVPLDAWLKCSPMIPKPHKDFSGDFPGSPDWDEFFFTEAGDFLPPKKAKAIFKRGFKLANLRVAGALAHISNSEHPLHIFLDKTRIRKSGSGETDLESALEANTSATDFENGMRPGWQFDKLIRWTQGGRGKVETWRAKVKGREFHAIRLTMVFLPTGFPLDQKPKNYANVSLKVDYPFLREEKSFSFKLREGETWIRIWESPPSPEGHTTFLVHGKADRAMTDQKQKSEPAEKKTAFDPFADKKSEAADDTTKAATQTNETPKPTARTTDPFQRAADTLAEKQRQAEAAREAAELARGVTTRVFLVVKAKRIINNHNNPFFQFRGLTLTTTKFQKRMRDDPAFRRQVETRRKREAAERAEKNRLVKAQYEDESKRFYAQLEAREDRLVCSEVMSLDVSERSREPVKLSEREEEKLTAWLDSIQPALLPRISLKGKYHETEVQLTPHLFTTRAEAEAFLKNKTTRTLNRTFQF